MRGDLRLAVAEALTVEAAVEVNLGDGNSAPIVRLCQWLAIVAVDGGDHPVGRGIGVGAADNVDMVFTGKCGTRQGVAAPHRPGDDLTALTLHDFLTNQQVRLGLWPD